MSVVEQGDRPGFIARMRDTDIWYSFVRNRIVMLAAFVTAVIFLGALFAPLVAPHNPFDLASLSLMDSLVPPLSMVPGYRWPSGLPLSRLRRCWASHLACWRAILAGGLTRSSCGLQMCS